MSLTAIPNRETPIRAEMVAVDAADSSKEVEAHSILAKNLERHFILLDLAADQCPNIHRFRGAVEIDTLVDDKGLSPYTRRIQKVLDDAVIQRDSPKWKQLETGIDHVVMYEEFPGKSLFENFELLKSLTPEQRYSMFAQMCRAVHTLHNIQIPNDYVGFDEPTVSLIHHDISPNNFLIRKPSGNSDHSFVVLSDFESATPLNETPMVKSVTGGTFLNQWYAPLSFANPEHRAAIWEDLHELSYSLGDIFLLIEGDYTFATIPREQPSFQVKRIKEESDRNYYAKISDINSELAYILRIANNRRENDLSIKDWWNNYIEPVLREYYQVQESARISIP